MKMILKFRNWLVLIFLTSVTSMYTNCGAVMFSQKATDPSTPVVADLSATEVSEPPTNVAEVKVKSVKPSRSLENCINYKVAEEIPSSDPATFKWFRDGIEIAESPNSKVLILSIDDPNWMSRYSLQVSDADGTRKSKDMIIDLDFIKASKVGSGNGYHTCEIYDDGKLRCHGFNIHNQLGFQSANSYVTLPTVVEGLNSGNIEAVTIGTHNTCVIIDGGVQCWGRNDAGQLGNNSFTSSMSPVNVVNMDSNVSLIASGGAWGGDVNNSFYDNGFTCAVKSGAVYCWGKGISEIMGTAINQSIPTPISVLTHNVESIAVGYDHACAVMNGVAYCWGRDSQDSGRLGDGTGVSKAAPVAVQGLSGPITSVGVGARFSCGLVNASVYCWGANGNGQLGHPVASLNKSFLPVLVPGMTDVAMMAVSDYGSCVAKKNFEVWCWGQTAIGSATPVLVKAFTQMPSSIAITGMGGAGNAYIVVNGFVYGFGQYMNQIGNPNTSSVGRLKLACLEEKN